MKKHMQKAALLVLAAMLFVVAGCSTGKPPKEALSAAMNKVEEADSFRMNMTFGLDELEIPQDLASQEDAAAAAMAIGLFKDAQFTMNGTYQKSPMRMDMNVEVLIPGDMEMKLSIPFKMTEDSIYIKIPKVPMFMLPDEITEKFVKFDLDELAGAQGVPQSNPEEQQKFIHDLSASIFKHFDEETYFSQPKPEDVGVPDDLKVDQVVSVEVNESNYPATVDTVIDKVLPEVLELLLNNEDYLKLASLQRADVEAFKSDLETNKAEAKEVLKKDVKINKLQLITAIQDGYPVYQSGDIDVQATDPELGGTMRMGLGLKITISDINKNLELEELPTDVIPSEELEQLFSSSMGMGL